MEKVKLGVMPPLTGLVGIYGTEIARAAQIACQEVNENGGVLGRDLELAIEDDGSLPESAVSAAAKLVDEHGCAAIIGNLLSNSRIAVAYRIAEPRKVPFLNFSFYEGSILSRYFFHYAALPNQQIDKMIPYMREQYGPRMFFAGNNYEWPRGSIDAAKRVLTSIGGAVLGEEYTAIGVSVADIDSLLDHVEAAAPDVFVPYFAGADQVNLLTRFTERGMKSRIAVVMGHYDELMASKLSAEIREGFYSSNTYFMTVETSENLQFLKRLSAWHGVTGIWPEGNGILTNFGEGTYICVKAFAKAANLAGTLESEALVDALNTLTVSGPQGDVRMDPVSHHARVNTYLSRCNRDGRFEIIQHFGAIDPVMPDRYNHQRISHQATLEDDIRLQARMLEQMSEGVMLIDLHDEQILYANAGAERLFGYEKNELSGKSRLQLDLQDERGDANPDVGVILSRQGYWQGELNKLRKDGSSVWCAASFSTFTHPLHGEVWMAVYNDISARKKAEADLFISEERLRRVIDATNDGIWDWNVVTHENYLSPRWKEILGYRDDELQNVESTFFELIHPDDGAKVSTAIARHFEQQEPYNIELRMRNRDDEYRWIHSRGEAVRDSEDKAVRMVGSITDITERKRAEEELRSHREHLEELVEARTIELKAANENLQVSLIQLKRTQNQLVQAEKMASLGAMVAGVAHEINTPVGVGVTAISHLQMKLEEYNERYRSGRLTREDFESLLATATESSDIIQSNLDRAANLIRSFKQVAVDQTSNEMREFNLHDYIREILQSVKPKLKAGDHTVTVHCPEDITIHCHPGAVSQVITNLVMNSITHGFADKRQGSISLEVRGPSEGMIRIEYKDNGAGMSSEAVRMVFEPFYTTRRGQGGTGLGMHITYNLITQTLGGNIECRSTEGDGVVFSIWLPINRTL